MVVAFLGGRIRLIRTLTRTTSNRLLLAAGTGSIVGTLATRIGADDPFMKILRFGAGFFLGSACVTPLASKLLKRVAPISLRGGISLGVIGGVISIIFYGIYSEINNRLYFAIVRNGPDNLIKCLINNSEVSNTDLTAITDSKCSNENVLLLLKKNPFTSDYFPKKDQESDTIEWENYKRACYGEEDAEMLRIQNTLNENFELRIPNSKPSPITFTVTDSDSDGLNSDTPEIESEDDFVLLPPDSYIHGVGSSLSWKESISLDDATLKNMLGKSMHSQSTKTNIANEENLNVIFNIIKNKKLGSLSINWSRTIIPPNPTIPASLLLFRALQNPLQSSNTDAHYLCLNFKSPERRHLRMVTYREKVFSDQYTSSVIGIFSKNNNQVPVCIVNFIN
ncbi:MAG: hypothetical protein K1060chlam2_01579 [Chlamydiae bacterium]|nr:hypothetical protein [Chlamydiota bacterium]